MQTPEKLLWIMVFSFFTLFVPDMITYANWQWKAHELTDFAVETMSESGGMTAQAEEDISKKMAAMGIDPADWSISYSNGIVKAPGTVSFSLSSNYRVKAFGVFGKSMQESMSESTRLSLGASSIKSSEIH
ncbi:hypothetical protein M2444_004758 [Paenibacillus sp. PastF-3]|uniref:hypothetical protein n=1 Tax=unclassified Paenibacillus TaxID=185978 RepID=UPI000B9F9B4E|nr:MULTISPECIES: hypothetical protein [unclassified Paenibacillus]MBY3621107.1 hypothetical protein [Acinetobacter sp. CUI P1]MDH6372929.1 hypothetical protein [Paenibacillus sp. PastF-3]OZQ77340.1 hypothetical protein CA598_29865 [Paenibacillus sp. VTT E-133291]